MTFFLVVNLCILYGKKYIYDCRINSEVVNIVVFIKKLLSRIEIELMTLICGKSGTMTDLWVSLCNLLKNSQCMYPNIYTTV